HHGLLRTSPTWGKFWKIPNYTCHSSLSIITLIPTHNFVENFSGAIPANCCYIHLLDNNTSEIKLTMNLTAKALLRISIPMDANKKQEQCHRFRQTRWQLLNYRDVAINHTELETEPYRMESNQCQTHDHNNEVSPYEHWTGVTGWTGLCLLRLAYATIVHFCAVLCLFSVPLWPSESARWLIISGKLDKSFKEMKTVAHLNGLKDVGENLHIEVLPSAMEEELAFLRHGSKKRKVIASPIMCRIIFFLFFLRFSAIFFLYELMFDLQNLGSNMFLSQALLGAADFPMKSLSFFAMRFLKRQPSIAFVLFLAGCSTLINIFIRQDFNKRKSRVEGVIIFVCGLASALGYLVLLTRQYFEPLPMILCGIFPIVACICVYFLPETLNLPLPDTIEDVEIRN
ncbi:hypothetical protein HPG69_011726, partial [Diceros bicornis minor]